MRTYGPQHPACDLVHQEKYRGKGETFRDAITRVASGLTKDEPDAFQPLREILLNMRFLPAGRIQAAIGTSKATCAHNCFVSGTIEDSFTAGSGSIMGRATEAAATMRMGGGIGYDFSTLRPSGALIRKLDSHSGGPIPFMEIFDAICRATSSAGARRGAQMGVLRVDHPDIEEFIRAKQGSGKFTGFNFSVGITDGFMEAVKKDEEFGLTFEGHVYKTIWARPLWDAIMRSTFDWAEPGILFIDRINELNNLYYCETIAATNPCGEQPLPPYGACLLGSFNLTQYLQRNGTDAPWTFDYEQLSLDIPWVVRAMDRVIDIARYPLHEQEKEALSKRRMGIGITGAANAIEALGHPYGSRGYIAVQGAILRSIRDNCYQASALLAKEKGSFPLYQKEKYLNGKFIQTLSNETFDLIEEHGIRNSHLLSIAPTGTISLSADNISSGIEPVFDHQVERIIIEATGHRKVTIDDYGTRYLGSKGKKARDVTVAEHLEVLKCAAQYVDSAVSKTCNLPKDIEWEDFKDVYIQAYDAGCKGCTTYREGGKLEGILRSAPAVDREEVSEDATLEGATCVRDPVTGRTNCE